MSDKSLYEILGVKVDATDAQIKRAFRKRAKRAHPDMGGDPEKFREINHAYEVLSDPERRQRYNETGQGGNPAAADAHQKNIGILSGIILQAVQQNPLGCNPIEATRQIITNRIAQIRDTAGKDIEIANRLRHMAENVLRNREGENLISSVLENQANGGQEHAAKLTQEADALGEVLKMLDDYRWKPDGENRTRPTLNSLRNGAPYYISSWKFVDQ
jgi:curved DNA-binding protein CbpA